MKEQITLAAAPDPAARDDIVRPFQIDSSGIRGRLVRMGPTIDGILKGHGYPTPVAALLGELLSAAALLSHMLKFKGMFALQIKGDGPISLMVADVTESGDMRGYAGFDADAVAAAQAEADRAAADGAVSETAREAELMRRAVPRMLGKGYLAFTVDPTEGEGRYQGIVELTGDTLASCIHHYFEQSEQLKTDMKLAVGRVQGPDGSERWRSAGLMLQRLPRDAEVDATAEDDADAWTRAGVLMRSATPAELLDPDLTADDLLYRLFHEDGVRVFDPRPVQAVCRCSEDRVRTVLRSLRRHELDELRTDDGTVVVTCEFCSKAYVYDDAALDAVFAESA